MSRSTLFSRTVRISSWLGDIILTGLAVWLAIHNRDQMTLHLAFALGLCVVLGGLLPIAVYIVDYLFAQNERRLVEARGPENLHAALLHLDELSRRVEEAARSAAKSTIVARQIPDRIEERFKQLSALGEQIESESLTEVVESIRQLSPRLEAMAAADRSLESNLEKMQESFSGELTHIHQQLASLNHKGAQTDEDDSASFKMLAERIETLQANLDTLRQVVEGDGLLQEEKLESIIERLDAHLLSVAPDAWSEDPLEEELAERAVQSEPDATPDNPSSTNPEPREQSPSELPTGSSAKGEEDVPLLDDWVEEPEDAEGEFLAETDEAEAGRDALNKTDSAEAHPRDPQTMEGELFPGHTLEASVPKVALPAGTGQLQVKAFVGISNRLFARGDPPLRWDEGTPLKPSGIGEWLLELSGMEEPVEIELRINDELAAQGKPIRMAPGEVLRVSPRFPQ